MKSRAGAHPWPSGWRASTAASRSSSASTGGPTACRRRWSAATTAACSRPIRRRRGETARDAARRPRRGASQAEVRPRAPRRCSDAATAGENLMPPSIECALAAGHHRRVGAGAARGVRRVPRRHRRRGPAPSLERRPASTPCGRASHAWADAHGGRPAHRGRQARARRPLQRRRDDRGRRAPRRLRRHLRRHPLTRAGDRAVGGRGGRRPDRPVDPVRLAPRARAAGASSELARRAPRRHPGRPRRHRPGRATCRRSRAIGVEAVFTPKDFDLMTVMGRILDVIGAPRESQHAATA